MDRNYDELVVKYDNRESRPEDLDKIAQLELTVKSAQAEVDKVHEEMKYFKLELRNREQNFNKTFGAGPNVGVMQPLGAMRTAVNVGQAVGKMQKGTKLPQVGRPSSGSRSGRIGGRPPSGSRRPSR